jgi:hypothetical protein
MARNRWDRWILAAAFGLAVAACSTTKDSRTASADEAREEQVATADDERREAQADPQDEAAEQAPSARPQSGVGSQDPHPMTDKDAEGDETFSGNAPQQQGGEGRVPPSRQPEADAQASATGTADASGTGAAAGTGATADTGTGASAAGDVSTGGAGTDTGASVSGDVDAGATAGTGATADPSTGATTSGDVSAGTSGTGAASGGTMATPREVTGRVALVDEEAREIAIDSGDATTQVKVAEDAQILINGEKGDLDDVKQGQEVRASLDAQPEGPQATRVEVTSKAKE